MRVLHVIAKNNGISNPAILGQCNALNNYVTVDLFTYEASSLLNYVKAAQSLRHKTKVGKYDIIHAHFSRSGLISIFASHRIPVVVSFMGTDILGSSVINKFVKVFIELFARHIIIKSKEMADILLFQNNPSVIPTGIDLDMFREIDKEGAKNSLGLLPDKRYILFVGNPKRKEKNYKLAAMAFNRLRKTEDNLELLTIYRKPHEAMPLYLNACDVLLMTSFYEGSPNTIKEAMACNCPIVSTYVGDVKKVIGCTEGCYITSFNPEDVAAALSKALLFGKRTNGCQAIGHLEQHIIAKKIVRVYERILGPS